MRVGMHARIVLLCCGSVGQGHSKAASCLDASNSRTEYQSNSANRDAVVFNVVCCMLYAAGGGDAVVSFDVRSPPSQLQPWQVTGSQGGKLIDSPTTTCQLRVQHDNPYILFGAKQE
jgi:hypothetical protein